MSNFAKNQFVGQSLNLISILKSRKLDKKGYCIKLVKHKCGADITFWIVVSDVKKPKSVYGFLGYYKLIANKKLCFICIDKMSYWVAKNAYLTYSVKRLLFFICLSNNFIDNFAFYSILYNKNFKKLIPFNNIDYAFVILSIYEWAAVEYNMNYKEKISFINYYKIINKRIKYYYKAKKLSRFLFHCFTDKFKIL